MSFENFDDVANCFTRGENWTHADNEHSAEDCLAWQKGVHDFGKFLDQHGTVPPEVFSALWRAIYGARNENG